MDNAKGQHCPLSERADANRKIQGCARGGAMKGEFSTGDPFVATMFVYKGLPCIKVTGFSNTDTQYTFRVKEWDAAIIQEEFHSNIGVLVQDWIRALKHVQGLQRTAKESGGVWTSPEYAERAS